ncbi:hypothetical protein ACG3SL_18595 [Sphingomonas sp. CJ20]
MTLDFGFRAPGLQEAKEQLAALRAASEHQDPVQERGGQWQVVPWGPSQVYTAILANLDHDVRLDPESIGRRLSTEAKVADASVGRTTRYKFTPYSCGSNLARIPTVFIGRVCAGGTMITEQVYASGMELSRGVAEPGLFIGAFLRSAAARNLQLVDLNLYPEFREAHSARNRSLRLSATLVLSLTNSRLVVIYTATDDQVAGDRVMFIVIYGRG